MLRLLTVFRILAGVTGVVIGTAVLELEAVIGIAAFLFPLRSSLNQVLKVASMLLRFLSAPPGSLCMLSPLLIVFPGELAGVGARSNVAERVGATTHGELGRLLAAVASRSGVLGSIGVVSFTGLRGGDFVKREGVCPLRESVDEDWRLSFSSLRSFSFSFSSFTASLDFLRTSPAASNAAVVAR